MEGAEARLIKGRTTQTHRATIVYAINSLALWRILPLGAGAFLEIPR